MSEPAPINAADLALVRGAAQSNAEKGWINARWTNDVVLQLIAEIDRLAYMVWRGGPDELVTAEPWTTGSSEHLVINGWHACSPNVCDEEWSPPPAESWTLPQ